MRTSPIKKFFQIVFVLSVVSGAMAVVNTNVFASYKTCGYKRTFNDDFNGKGLNNKKWNTEYPSGNGGEQQFYAPDAVSIKNGILKLTAEKRAMNGYPYTSGIVTTKDKFSQRYGLFTMRAKLPKGQGFWPAFWILPAKPAYPTEIDIFENLGNDPNTIYMTNHWRDANKVHQKTPIPYTGPDFSSKFHTFSVLWTPTELVWSVDGVEQYRTSKGVPNMPMFILANLAVGGKWPGNPDITTPFPSSMEIDYIRAFKYQCYRGLPALTNYFTFYNHENATG